MAEKRMLSKVISVSEKINSLPDVFDMLLFTWMIPHADDFGRLAGSPAKVKAIVVPMLDKTITDIKASLERLEKAGVILWYEIDGEKIIEIVDSDKHQNGLKSKKQKYHSPNGYSPSNDSQLTASEIDIEELVAEKLLNNEFIDGEQIISVERQLRIDNSYLDILATAQSGSRYLYEIKRQRLSNASIDQILKYHSMLNDSNVKCILIGNGLSSNFDLQKCKAEQLNVLVYDDFLNVESKLLFNVKCRYPLLLSNRTELNRTELELKGTERNGTEDDELFGGGVVLPPDGFNPYRFYEQEGFGTISPVTKDQIDDFVKTYGERWYQEAIKTAVLAGKRSMSYVNGILKRWKSEGIDEPWTKEKPPNKQYSRNVRPDIPIVESSTKQETTVSKEEFAELIELAKREQNKTKNSNTRR